MSSKFLSPGLASAQTLEEALPDKVAIFTCEWDQLYAEAEEFRRVLTAQGKQVGGRMIVGVDHAWDKVPSFRAHNPKRDEMYSEAAAQLPKMFGKAD